MLRTRHLMDGTTPPRIRPGCALSPRPRRYLWDAHIIGPKDTPYEGGFFELKIAFPEEYPFKPPRAQFVTKVYHPNIDRDGGICMDILKDSWTPALTTTQLLLAISTLLASPNPADPLVPEIAREFEHNYAQFATKARECTAKHAMPPKGAGGAAASSSSSRKR